VKKSKKELNIKSTKMQPPIIKEATSIATEKPPVIKNTDVNGCFDIDQMYKGGSNKWLVISLSEETEIEENYAIIEYEILNVFGKDTNYFIPVYKEKLGSKEICLVLFDGYVFVQEPKEGFNDIDFNRIRAVHVKSPLAHGGSFTFVKNKDINNFKRELKKKIKGMVPKVGQVVIPKEGVFKDLEGTVIGIDKDRKVLIVRFETSSRVVEAPVPFINVDYI
jgi:transcription antitermination factor NusG